ncbi:MULTISPECIES: hypothetical protein [Pseudofrankia]|uniref:hypothetical protein n=1 Tax=Pseudofrankia TaxID=2994363 RepID=UPI000234D704|nr:MULTISPECIES: hypothetical protein [Pseudofrankia]OHV36957.1 hypothetical protein BCD49_16960 [Pseudofrankia sp. EUN1h]
MSITDHDLRTRLRALPTELPQRVFAPAFPGAVRAGARRRRNRARVAGAAALAVLVAVGVGVPVGLLAGSGRTGASVVPARTPVFSFGGFSVTWLPDGLTHKLNTAAYGPVDGAGHGLPPGQAGSLPGNLTRRVVAADPTTFGSLFATTDARSDANPSAAWVTVTWRSQTTTNVHTMRQSVDSFVEGGGGNVDVTPDTVAGRPALVLRHDTATEAQFASPPSGQPTSPPAASRYQTALEWVDATGIVLSVELNGPSYPDTAVAHRIADGIVLGTMPTLAGYTPPGAAPVPVDAATAASARAAIEAVYTAGTPDDRWAAALQEGPDLLTVRAKTARLFPGLASTLKATVDTMTRVDADTVQASVLLSFTDPTVPTALGTDALPIGVTVARGTEGWQVTRASYCDNIASLQVPALSLAC